MSGNRKGARRIPLVNAILERPMRTLVLAAAGLLAATTAVAQSNDAPVDVNIAGATATIKNLAGENVGSASLRMTPSGIMVITASVSGLTQGWHGFHIHETGECDPATEFKSAGGHLADGKEHGPLVEGGPHPGDMPNQMVQETGVMVAEVFNHLLTEDMLFDADGSAIMIHSGRDDYQSQPSGDAGGRVACGVIERPQ